MYSTTTHQLASLNCLKLTVPAATPHTPLYVSTHPTVLHCFPAPFHHILSPAHWALILKCEPFYSIVASSVTTAAATVRWCLRVPLKRARARAAFLSVFGKHTVFSVNVTGRAITIAPLLLLLLLLLFSIPVCVLASVCASIRKITTAADHIFCFFWSRRRSLSVVLVACESCERARPKPWSFCDQICKMFTFKKVFVFGRVLFFDRFLLR